MECWKCGASDHLKRNCPVVFCRQSGCGRKFSHFSNKKANFNSLKQHSKSHRPKNLVSLINIYNSHYVLLIFKSFAFERLKMIIQLTHFNFQQCPFCKQVRFASSTDIALHVEKGYCSKSQGKYYKRNMAKIFEGNC